MARVTAEGRRGLLHLTSDTPTTQSLRHPQRETSWVCQRTQGSQTHVTVEMESCGFYLIYLVVFVVVAPALCLCVFVGQSF